MTSDEQKAKRDKSSRFRNWKNKLGRFTLSKSAFTELREQLEASLASGTISEFDDPGTVIPKLIDSLDQVEFLMACEDLHLDESWGAAKTIRELFWVLKKLEIEEKRRQDL